MEKYGAWLLGLNLFFTGISYAGTAIPECIAYGHPLPVINDQALHWKQITQNQFHDRSHIQGTLQKFYPDRSGHYHWQVKVGPQPKDTIEVIYNKEFGAIPAPALGVTVEACGDFITSTAPSQGYPASPDGALIHWVHMNPSGDVGHPHGFVAVGGMLYGQETPPNERHEPSFTLMNFDAFNP